MPGLPRRIFEYAFKPQLVVFAALLVPLIFWTHQVSLLSPLVNVLAIPLVGMVVVPMCLIAMVLSFLNTSLATLLLVVVDRIMGPENQRYQRRCFCALIRPLRLTWLESGQRLPGEYSNMPSNHSW